MIIVYAESIDGNFKKSTFEAVSYAAEMAKNLGTTCAAVSIGNVENSNLSELAKYGADKIVSIKQDKLNRFIAEAYAKALSGVALEMGANVIVISNTYTGKSIASRIAAKLKAGIASGVISLPDTSGGFKIRKTVFSGKAFADVNLNTQVKVLAITPNTFNIIEQPKSGEIINHTGNLTDADYISNPTEISRVTGKIPLTEAELVVSAGRGMKGPENWGIIEELAEVLGAATACSKPVSDMHWRPHSEHVGQTGITIKPNLYIAIGISGAIQHLAGVSSSKVIVAINKDPEAPFFKAADYGIVGDAFEVLPKILEAAKKLKAVHQ
jgi:electron transfer flavoprotein alpha subunit